MQIQAFRFVTNLQLAWQRIAKCRNMGQLTRQQYTWFLLLTFQILKIHRQISNSREFW